VLTVDNSDLKLFPGMTANVRIFTDSIINTLRVPNAAFRFKFPGAADTTQGKKQTGSQTIYVLTADGNPEQVRVPTGLTDGNFTAVSGNVLHEGDLLIIGASASGSSAAMPAPRGPTF
jgi:HlyD family secretion protein